METWYVLEGGEAGDPREISRGSDGVLRHKDGRAVAYAPHGPRSRSVDPEAERAKAVSAGKMSPNEAREQLGQPAIEPPSRDLTAADDGPAVSDRELKAKPSGRGYRTRGGKVE